MLVVEGRFSTMQLALRLRSGLPRAPRGLEVIEALSGEADGAFILAGLKGVLRKLQRAAHLAHVPAVISGALPSLDGAGQSVHRLGSRNRGSRFGFGCIFGLDRLRTRRGDNQRGR